jgi:hypothetical protein
MKRCPECQFIYPDTDRVCDFDQTPLVDATEHEIAAITNTPERPTLSDLAVTYSKKFESRKNKSKLPIAAAIGLLLGITAVTVYIAVHRQMRPQPVQQQARSVEPIPMASVASPSPSLSVVESQSPEPASEKPSNTNSKTSTAHATTSIGPVSTGTPTTSVKTRGKQVILLNGGGKIEADEVWRTKDGVWYRRDGVVTLLKKNRVKSIVNQ